MMDDVDRAKIIEQKNRSASVQAALNTKSKREQMLIDGVPHCVDCYEEIPVQRLSALPGAVRCVECEEIMERRL
tara:strand:+ start:300 stop:521 length:222 start_codon:yes stop_codon:yes gene_type:complete